MAVQMKLNGVVQQSGPASGNGSLAFVFRITMNDRQSGDMTIVDFPVNMDFPMTGGKAKVKTSVDAYLNALPSMQPGLPKCSSSAIIFSAVMDPDGATFANAGLFMP